MCSFALLLFLLLSVIWPSFPEVINLSDNTFDSVLDAFASSNALVLFKSHNCRHCEAMEKECEILSNDQHVRDASVLVVSVNDGPLTRNLRIRFSIRTYPTILYLKDDRMYTYRGERNLQHMRSFILKGYENQGEGDLIPPKMTIRNRLKLYVKAARDELREASNGEMGLLGYTMVLLTGIVSGLLFMLVYVVIVLAQRKLKET